VHYPSGLRVACFTVLSSGSQITAPSAEVHGSRDALTESQLETQDVSPVGVGLGLWGPAG
jgi:hypothetical protein